MKRTFEKWKKNNKEKEKEREREESEKRQSNGIDSKNPRRNSLPRPVEKFSGPLASTRGGCACQWFEHKFTFR